MSRYHCNTDMSAHEFKVEVEQRFGSGSHAQPATDRFGRVRSLPSSDGSSASPPRRGVLKKHSSLTEGGGDNPRSFTSAIDQAREVRNCDCNCTYSSSGVGCAGSQCISRECVPQR
jgi:hypothetical protein